MLHQKLLKLKENIKALKKVAVAFSGGVDSTFLLKVCIDELGSDNVLAVTAHSQAITNQEFIEAQTLANLLKARQIIIQLNELDDPFITNNPPERCYYCKKQIFNKFIATAKEQGYNFVLEGSNFSDKDDFRPGMRAIKELGVLSPLKDAGLTKDEIRQLSKEMGLPTWNKPSYACLFSRFPYGEKITPEKLKRVAQAETILRENGFGQFRVRSHSDLARIEVLPEDIDKFFDQPFRNKIVNEFKKIGFTYITLDLSGYRSGSMNEQLKEEDMEAWKN